MDKPSPSRLAEQVGISPSYASMILNDARKPPLALAARIFDATGLQFGPLKGLSKAEVATLRRLDAKAAA